jgi:hypothetical protein
MPLCLLFSKIRSGFSIFRLCEAYPALVDGDIIANTFKGWHLEAIRKYGLDPWNINDIITLCRAYASIYILIQRDSNDGLPVE